MNSVLRSLYKTTILSLAFIFLKFLKFTQVIGSKFAFFTPSSMFFPVLGAFSSAQELLFITAGRTLLYIGAHPLMGFFGALYHIPSLCGALYLQKTLSHQNRLIRFIVPLICIALFVATPVGGQAWAYSIFWLIPAAIALFPRTTVFTAALASTFMTHAAGSVLFIYVTPMTPAFWIALMPVVLLERCGFALGITALYYNVLLIQKIAQKLSTRALAA